MRVVIVDHEDYEPLTVVEAHRDFLKLPFFRLPVYLPIAAADWDVHRPCVPADLHVVNLQWVHQYRSLYLAKTTTPETALLLRAAFLPGQRTHLRQHEDEAFEMATGRPFPW